MLCKAAHETQNNVDEKKENQYLAGEKTRSLQWWHNLFLAVYRGHDDYIRLERKANANCDINLWIWFQY